MSKIVVQCVRFIFVLLLANLLKTNCYSINDGNGELDLDKVIFFQELLQLPAGISDENLNKIRSTLKKFEKEVFELKEAARYCRSSRRSNCLPIYNQLLVILESLSKNKSIFIS